MKLRRFIHTARYDWRAKRKFEGEPYTVVGYQIGKLIVQRSWYEPFYTVTNFQGRLLTSWWGLPLSYAIAFAKAVQSGGLDYSGDTKDLTERHKSRVLAVRLKFKKYVPGRFL